MHDTAGRCAAALARISQLAIALAACGCGHDDLRPRPIDTTLARAGTAGPAVERLGGPATRLRVDTIARGLRVPWGVAPLPDGRLLVTERAGRIRVVDSTGLRVEPWATLDVYADDPRVLPEAGLMGIAVAPDFVTTGHVYVLGTVVRRSSDTASSVMARVRRRVRAAWADPLERTGLANQLWRFTDRSGRGLQPTFALGISAGTNYYHAGGALAFDPDGALYLSLGDAMLPEHAGSMSLPLARVLRITPLVPGAWQVTTHAPFALGLRNVQGLAWHPGTGTLFAIDHGPTGMEQEGGRRGHDELNALRDGAWYGWGAAPAADPGEAGIAPVPPVAVWPQAIAPAGLVSAPPAWGADVLLVTGLRSGALHRLELARDSSGTWRVRGEERLLEGHGRLRALATDASGAVYVGTSNHDGRGTPRADDDLLLRVRPAP